MNARSASPAFPSLLQDFFCQRLIQQRDASARTVESYRDAFRLLLQFASDQLGKPPTDMTLVDFEPSLVLAFLDHIEHRRGNCVRSRNARLAAIRSFMHYASLRDPIAMPSIQRVLAIPMKRFDRPLLDFLSREEVDAILAATDLSKWSGRRDRAMHTTFYNTGARVSEVAGLQVGDLFLERENRVRIRGKGRKERVVPLWKSTANLLAAWSKEIPSESRSPLFPNRAGQCLSRSGIADRLAIATRTAARSCPSLKAKRVTPHTLRHTTAMHLLQSGVGITVIALWLGHESPATTHMYVEADLTMKQRALDRVPSPHAPKSRLIPSDRLLAFLDGL